jgi:hypothetical protein
LAKEFGIGSGANNQHVSASCHNEKTNRPSQIHHNRWTVLSSPPLPGNAHTFSYIPDIETNTIISWTGLRRSTGIMGSRQREIDDYKTFSTGGKDG